MAYSATELLEARAFLEDAAAGKVQANELRRPITNATTAFVQSTPSAILGGSSTLENLKKSDEQTLKIPVQTKLSADNGTARSCATSGTDGDSAMITLSYNTYTEKFSMSELLHANNNVDYQASFRHKMLEKMRILHQRVETYLAAYLESNRSAVNNGTLNTFTAATGQMTVALANKNSFFSRAATEMMQNNFMPVYYNVHSMGLMNEIILQQNEGSGNSNNLAPQQSMFEHFGTNLIPTTGSTSSTSFLFVPGTVGLVTFNNVLHKRNVVEGNDTWTTLPSPFYPGWNFDVKIKTGCVDNSGTSATRGADLVTYVELVLEFAPFKAYTSTTDTGIYKYALASS